MLWCFRWEAHVARYKEVSQDRIMVAISLEEQLIPGSFEFTLREVIDNRLDLSPFDQFYTNDQVGPKAFSPKSLLKVVLYAYSKGLLSSRKIEAACRTNVLFMALAGEARPDHATLASFVSTKCSLIKDMFVQVLAICAELGLIGMEQFALDGCKLSSNAAKEHSGTFAEYQKRLTALDAKVQLLMKQHQHNDSHGEQDRIQKAIRRIQQRKDRIQRFLATHSPRVHHGRHEVKSNLTDNESAKLKTANGYIQGYNALALSDARHQIVLNAYAIGRQYEGDELQAFLTDSQHTAAQAGILDSQFRSATLLADTNYFSEHNCRFLLRDQKMQALIPDPHFRSRDVRFQARATAQGIHKADFIYDPTHDRYRCPQGKLLSLYTRVRSGPHRGRKYRSQEHDCKGCPLAQSCLTKGARRRTLFVADEPSSPSYTQRMRQLVDSPQGRQTYARRMVTIEPVFGNIKHTKGMDRFTLRGAMKVSIQWLCYCLVHNIEKIATTGAIGRLQMA
jgi:transposase